MTIEELEGTFPSVYDFYLNANRCNLLALHIRRFF